VDAQLWIGIVVGIAVTNVWQRARFVLRDGERSKSRRRSQRPRE